ncbi:MAG: DUF4911 domain-containing protein [SAR324 cluster bacterium]|uniref:DUF4911 domain-containing protein n=1 Tax=SAR324 cluster bacterium TaxID=2024889 RepID=A0A7X9FSI3_9DELT|nr:DUF4911 domain-containing protein [SAR324 cluster bacterium]
MKEGCEKLDEYAVVLHIEVPGSKVVLFQAFFELHEAIGIVRTIDIRRSRVCVVTTEDMLPDCLKLLEALKDQIPWRFVESTEDGQKIFGYSRKGIRQENSYD